MTNATPSELKTIIEMQSRKDCAFAEQAKELREMRKKFEELERRLDQQGGGGGAPAVVNNTVNNIQQNIYNFNSFGNESLSHLKGFTQNLLASGKPTHEVIEILGTKIWCDLNYPENGTLVCPNTKGKMVRTRRADGTWELRDKAVVHRQAHTKITSQAYDNQPKTVAGAMAASPILKEMHAIEEGRAPFPVGVYDSIATGARVHAHNQK